MKKVFNTAHCKFSGRTILIQYGINTLGSACVRIFNDQGYTINQNGDTKDLLRKINTQLNLNVSLANDQGNPKITHQLAKHIIKAING
jgi:hypothetical protein